MSEEQRNYPNKQTIENTDRFTGVGDDGSTYNFEIDKVAEYVVQSGAGATINIYEIFIGVSDSSIWDLVNNRTPFDVAGNDTPYFRVTRTNNIDSVYLLQAGAGTYGFGETQTVAGDYILIDEDEINVDTALSDTSENPVENKAITAEFESVQAELDTKANLAGGNTFNGDQVFTDNVTVQGDFQIQNVVDLIVSDNVIEVNAGETGAGVTARYAGIQIDRGTLPDKGIIFDEVDDTLNFGDFNTLNGSIVAATSTTVTLDANASSNDDEYNGNEMKIFKSGEAAQVVTITDYVGATKVATVSPVMSPIPDNTWNYRILIDNDLRQVAVKGILADTNLVKWDDTTKQLEDTGVSDSELQTLTDGSDANALHVHPVDNVMSDVSANPVENQVVKDYIDTEIAGVITTTDLSFTRDATTVTVESSTGTDAILPSATVALAGVLQATDKAKIDDAALKSVANPFTAKQTMDEGFEAGYLGTRKVQTTSYGIDVLGYASMENIILDSNVPSIQFNEADQTGEGKYWRQIPVSKSVYFQYDDVSTFASAKNALVLNPLGSVDLYYDGAKVLETVSGGAKTTGTQDVTVGYSINGIPLALTDLTGESNLVYKNVANTLQEILTIDKSLLYKGGGNGDFTVKNDGGVFKIISELSGPTATRMSVSDGATIINFSSNERFRTTDTGTTTTGVHNATTDIQIGGTSINTAGTLSNVAYSNVVEDFTAGGIKISGDLFPQIQFDDGTANRLLFTDGGNNLKYRYDGVNDGIVYHSENSNIGTVSWNASDFLLNGTSINTAGTLSNVAYLDNTQTITGAKTFTSPVVVDASTDGLTVRGNTTSLVFKVERYGTSANVFRFGTDAINIFQVRDDAGLFKLRLSDDANTMILGASNTVYHSGNSNLNTVDWSVNNLTAAGTVTADNIGSISSKDFWQGTQAAYDAIVTPDANTIYYIEE
jgi:hypothetical protein